MHMCFILFDSLMVRGDSLMVSHEPLTTTLVVHRFDLHATFGRS